MGSYKYIGDALYNTPDNSPTCWCTSNSPDNDSDRGGSAFDGRYDLSPGKMNTNTQFTSSYDPLRSGVVGFSASTGLTSMMVVSFSINVGYTVPTNTARDYPLKTPFRVPGANDGSNVGSCIASCLTQSTYSTNNLELCYGGYEQNSPYTCATNIGTSSSWTSLPLTSNAGFTAFTIVSLTDSLGHACSWTSISSYCYDTQRRALCSSTASKQGWGACSPTGSYYDAYGAQNNPKCPSSQFRKYYDRTLYYGIESKVGIQDLCPQNAAGHIAV